MPCPNKALVVEFSLATWEAGDWFPANAKGRLFSLGFLCDLAGKKSACNVGNQGLIPGLERSPGEGKAYPLQYSGLENSMNCIFMPSQRVGHDWSTLTFPFIPQLNVRLKILSKPTTGISFYSKNHQMNLYAQTLVSQHPTSHSKKL